MLLNYLLSAFAAAFSKSCSTMKPLVLASSAYESSLLAIKIFSLGIPESLKFWACAAPWFPNLIRVSARLHYMQKALTQGRQSACCAATQGLHRHRSSWIASQPTSKSPTSKNHSHFSGRHSSDGRFVASSPYFYHEIGLYRIKGTSPRS